ncbi:TetR family transcriptional regulator [Streptosporangium sandarakinum]|uniref:TetR family transcriptional regulator n=1 Tax=Streptosporangium TaxID=2000 RepID=UPI0031F95D6B
MSRPGLRERKKQKTRLALIDAALDLFAEQGYDATTVDQIAAAVDVSPRTFFRYFATKEDVALSLDADGQEILLAELAARPAEEPPFTALGRAMNTMITILEQGDTADRSRFLKARELIEATPALFAGGVRMMMQNERLLVAEIARREGMSPDDLLPHFVVSLFTSAIRVGLEACGPGELNDLSDLTRHVERVLELAERSLRPGWDRPAPGDGTASGAGPGSDSGEGTAGDGPVPDGDSGSGRRG